MAYALKWSPRAASGFQDICNFIAKDSRRYAAIFANKVNALVKSIPELPEAGRVVPEYADVNIRERILGNYRIVYRIRWQVIEIVAICHGAKPLDNIH